MQIDVQKASFSYLECANCQLIAKGPILMILSMFLSHLVGDYILQWDSLAMWKARAMSGIIAHCLVVAAVTFLFAMPFGGDWWQIALIISIGHFIIDAVQLPLTSRPSPPGMFALARFTADQIAHTLVILGALYWGGYLNFGSIIAYTMAEVRAMPELVYVFGYTCLAMPAWVMLEFIIYGLVKGSAPDFSRATNKYVGSMERWLIMTCVLLGQYLLVPLVAAPRFLFERPRINDADTREMNLYIAKLLASIMLAVTLGLALRRLVP